MCETLRNTDSRGRSELPCIRLRMRYLMRWRRSSLVLICMLGPSLSCLLLQHFARVAHALLLIRIGLTETPQVGRDLTDQLSIDARDRDVRLLVDRNLDSRRDIEHDWVRVPQREHDLLALGFCTVSDADNVELFLEPFGHT